MTHVQLSTVLVWALYDEWMIYLCVYLKFGYFQLLVLHHYDLRISATEIMEEIVGIKHGNFLVYDFWTPPPPPLLSILYMGLTESVLT